MLEQDEKGRQIPKKVGVGYTQRDGLEFEYTVTFNIDQTSHVADATKDNTHLFEGKYEVLTEKHGEALYNWANQGDKPTPKPKKEFTPSITSVLSEIDAVARELKEKIGKEDTLAAIKSAAGVNNYNSITDIDVARATLEALKSINK